MPCPNVITQSLWGAAQKSISKTNKQKKFPGDSNENPERGITNFKLHFSNFDMHISLLGVWLKWSFPVGWFVVKPEILEL